MLQFWHDGVVYVAGHCPHPAIDTFEDEDDQRGTVLVTACLVCCLRLGEAAP